MTLHAGRALGLLAAALAVGVLVWWVREPRVEPASTPEVASGTRSAVEAIETAGEPPLEAVPPEHEGRSIADAGESGVPKQEGATEAFGTLRVYVRSRDTGKALAKVRLFLVPGGEDHWMYEPVDAARGRPGVGPLSGDDGLAEFEMPLGLDYTLRAQRGTFHDEAEDLSVPPFALPETREIVLELRTVYDRPFVGRVVTFGSEEPIPGASISIADGFLEVHADADGYFETLLPPSYMLHAEAKASGYAAAIFDVGGHESREDARVVRMQRAARLDVLVLARDGAPLEGARVRASTDVYHVAQCMVPHAHGGPLRWSSLTGAAGRCSLTDLPPSAPLSIEYEKEWSFRKAEGAPVWLAPGEVREIVFRLGRGATVAGVLLDENGDPAEEVEIWLVPSETGTPRYFTEGERFAASASTDSMGRFELADVTDGTWWVGPAPGGTYPSLAQVVEVVDGVADRTVYLDGAGGRFIEGRVVDSSGAPIKGVFVFVIVEGLQDALYDYTDESGMFSVGPLAPGAFWVSASAIEGYTDSDPIRANAGDKNVLIQLHVAGGIRGKLVSEATGAPVKGRVIVTSVNRTERWSGWRMTWADEDGTFDLSGLEPGLYFVAGGTEGAEFACQPDITVAAGSEPAETLLEVRPGATLVLRYEGDQPYGQFQARFGDAVVAADGVERLHSTRSTVPAGAIHVECWVGFEAPEVHELTFSVGEERELVFGRK